MRGVVSSSGSLTASTSYDAWGNPETTGGLTSHTPFGFAGGYTDPTGLLYLIGRYYDPGTGQFLSVDPLVQETGQPYAYTGDDPVNAVDPLGLFPGQGFLDKARHKIASGADLVNNGVNSGYEWLDGVAQQTECGAVNDQGPLAGPLGCATTSGQTADCPDGGAGIAATTGGNLNAKSARYFKNAGIDPEDLKDEYGYSSDGDLFVQSGTGRVFVGPKRGTASDMEPTNFRIVNGEAQFDPPTIEGFGDGFDFFGE